MSQHFKFSQDVVVVILILLGMIYSRQLVNDRQSSCINGQGFIQRMTQNIKTINKRFSGRMSYSKESSN